jgi:hypothetical protein
LDAAPYFVPLPIPPFEVKVALACYGCQQKEFYVLTGFQSLPPHICDQMEGRQSLGFSDAQKNERKQKLDDDVARILMNTVNDWISGEKKLEAFVVPAAFEMQLPSWVRRLKYESMDTSFRGFVNRAIESIHLSPDMWTILKENEVDSFLRAASATSVLVHIQKGELQPDSIWYLVRIVPPQYTGPDGRRQLKIA